MWCWDHRCDYAWQYHCSGSNDTLKPVDNYPQCGWTAISHGSAPQIIFNDLHYHKRCTTLLKMKIASSKANSLFYSMKWGKHIFGKNNWLILLDKIFPCIVGKNFISNSVVEYQNSSVPNSQNVVWKRVKGSYGIGVSWRTWLRP